MKTTIPMLDLQHELGEIRTEVDAAIARILDSTQFIGGCEVSAFEQEVAKYLGCRHAIGCNSGTDAILLALRSHGIGSGDEVITTSFSFFATAEPISLLGAEPVFVDIDPDTYNIDPRCIESALTPKTKAIVPVHLYGRPAPMEDIVAIAKRHSLIVIEDCAQAFGAHIDGRRVGTFGSSGAFSFFPSKTLGAFGDAGMVCTDDDKIAASVKKLRAHGASVKYHNEVLGYNSRLDALQAGILRVKLKRLEAQNARRRKAAARYDDLFSGLQTVSLPETAAGHVYHQYTIRVHDGCRDALQSHLATAGIASTVYYPIPIHRLPVYDHLPVDLEVTEKASEEVLSLPIWPGMALDIQATVAETLLGFYR